MPNKLVPGVEFPHRMQEDSAPQPALRCRVRRADWLMLASALDNQSLSGFAASSTISTINAISRVSGRRSRD